MIHDTQGGSRWKPTPASKQAIFTALTPHSLSRLYLLFSLLCANESRLSTAGRALRIRSQPRWQSLAKLVGKSKKKRWEALAEPGAVCVYVIQGTFDETISALPQRVQ